MWNEYEGRISRNLLPYLSGSIKIFQKLEGMWIREKKKSRTGGKNWTFPWTIAMKIYRYRFQREFHSKLFGIVLIQIADILRPAMEMFGKYERAKIHDPCQRTMTFVKPC